MTTPLLPAPEAAATEGAARSFCTFRLGESLYGIDVSLVQSVSTLPPLTPIPHAPASVRGYVNLRGQVHLVVDLARLLGLGTTATGADARLVLLKPALGDPFGVLADRIGDIVSLRPEQIEERNGAAEKSARAGVLVEGVGKGEGELLVILNARQFLPAVRRAMVTGEGGGAS
jgi:purine-binding chemotaxis protein CheW